MHGPPPHAPAHGHRHKLRGHGGSLTFDSGLGVYVVVGHGDLFYWRDHFYRWHDGGWQTSAPKDGCFQRVRYTKKKFSMPVGLNVHANGLRVTWGL